MLRMKLVECGWRDELQSYCRSEFYWLHICCKVALNLSWCSLVEHLQVYILLPINEISMIMVELITHQFRHKKLVYNLFTTFFMSQSVKSEILDAIDTNSSWQHWKRAEEVLQGIITHRERWGRLHDFMGDKEACLSLRHMDMELNC